MPQGPTVPSLFALDVTLWVSRSITTPGRPERFKTASRLFRRLHQIGQRNLIVNEVREGNSLPWLPPYVAALNLYLQAGKGLTYFRRTRPLSVSAYTWSDLKRVVGVRTQHSSNAHKPEDQIPARASSTAQSGEDRRVSQSRSERGFGKRVRPSSVHSVQPCEAGSAFPRPSRLEAVSGQEPFCSRRVGTEKGQE